MEKYRNSKRGLHLVFIDLEKIGCLERYYRWVLEKKETCSICMHWHEDMYEGLDTCT